MSDRRRSRILIVDDERDHAEVMCEALAREGHECDVTHSLGEAGRQLKRRRYDVIVTDLRMDGERDGLQLLKDAQDLSPPPPSSS